MAKSKLIVRRSKKATILVSKRTVEDALRRANNLAGSWMGQNENDPRFNELQNITDHLTSILKKTPQEMRAEGAASIEDYFDDAKMPDQATTLKREVNQIAKWHDEGRQQHAQPAEQPETGVGYVPDSAVVMSSQEEKVMADKQANGAAFVTDRDEKGEAKAPEKLEVPRLAKKKKKEAEDPAAEAAAPVPPVPPTPPVAEPAPAPAAAAPAAGGGNAIDYIPTETLIKVIGDIQKEDDFAQNRGKQDALIELTQVIKSRPVLQPEQPEAPAPAPAPSTAPALADAGAAVPPPVTASKTADLGDHAMSGDGSIGEGSSPSHSISPSTSRPSVSTAPKRESSPSPEKATVGFGGLEIASSLEDDKTADDYRLHDFKVQDEGIVPTGGLPSADEQANMMRPEEPEFEMDSSMEKEAVTPPGISEELMHKLKSEYPGDKEKAYATAWKIHNEKKSALKTIASALDKVANAYGGGWFSGSGKPMEVDEDGGRTPEIGEAHSMLDYSPAKLERPAVTAPIELNKQAAEMTTGKAVSKAEQLGNDLKKMYLDAKSLTQVNDTRAVREAVEGIFRAADAFDEAVKTLNKQDQQEKSEAEAAEIKAKNKKSSFGGLTFAAAE
jgi:hypothetical protein